MDKIPDKDRIRRIEDTPDNDPEPGIQWKRIGLMVAVLLPVWTLTELPDIGYPFNAAIKIVTFACAYIFMRPLKVE